MKSCFKVFRTVDVKYDLDLIWLFLAADESDTLPDALPDIKPEAKVTF